MQILTFLSDSVPLSSDPLPGVGRIGVRSESGRFDIVGGEFVAMYTANKHHLFII